MGQPQVKEKGLGGGRKRALALVRDSCKFQRAKLAAGDFHYEDDRAGIRGGGYRGKKAKKRLSRRRGGHVFFEQREEGKPTTRRWTDDENVVPQGWRG